MLQKIMEERLEKVKWVCKQDPHEEKRSPGKILFERKNVYERRASGKASRRVKTARGMKRCAVILRKWSATLLCVLACGIALNLGVSAAHRAILQRGIAEEVLRFHVLANSDSEEDQDVKLLVRDAVLKWIHEELDSEKSLPAIQKNEVDQKTEESGKKSELCFLSGHLSEIEEIANQVLGEQGMSYRAQASVENCYFPERTYGDCTFPAGWYDALRVQLGEAKGHNWWCVLYPGLCFSDCLHAVVDGDELADLKELLTVEEYESLLRKPKKWKIAFRWF